MPSNGTYYLRAAVLDASAGTGAYLIFTGTHASNRLDVARDARDVMLSSSPDGIHWSPRQRVNNDPPRFDNSFPEVAVDGRGAVHVIWYDHRRDRECGILTDVVHTRSRDRVHLDRDQESEILTDAAHGRSAGGIRFEQESQVNDGPPVNWNTVEAVGVNMGDYMTLIAVGMNVYANWTDGRLGTPDSWMATIPSRPVNLADGGPGEAPRSRPAEVANASPRLRVMSASPSSRPVRLEFTILRNPNAILEIFSVTGQRVRSLVDGPSSVGTQEVTWDGRDQTGQRLGSGVYFVRLTNGGLRVTTRVVLLD